MCSDKFHNHMSNFVLDWNISSCLHRHTNNPISILLSDRIGNEKKRHYDREYD